MNRRNFLRQAATASAGAAAVLPLAAPALAQDRPAITWRLTSSFPKNLDIIFGAANEIADSVKNATDGQFTIQIFAAGEIVPGLQAADAVANGTVEMAHTCSYYYIGQDPAFALGTAIPFGLNARMTNAWFTAGGGNDLINEFLAPRGLYALPAGNSGTQMGGWFRKEINTLEDLQGLKMGFHKVAKYYYYPAWWEGGPAMHAFFNLEKFNALPKSYQQILANACASANNNMLANYDARNAVALKQLVADGAILKPFSQEIMEACYKAAMETYAELSEKSPSFKTLYDSQLAFKKDAYLWAQVAEYSYDTFMMIQQRAGAL